MTRLELATVPPCTGCGRCCDKIGLPPFEVPNPDLGWVPTVLLEDEQQAEAWAADTETFLTMPAALRADHAAAVLALDADPTGQPCLWFDEASKSCRHYDHRPHVCRAWDVGDKGCEAARFRGAKVVWRDPHRTRPDDWWNPRGEVFPPPEREWPWDRERTTSRDARELATVAAVALSLVLLFASPVWAAVVAGGAVLADVLGRRFGPRRSPFVTMCDAAGCDIDNGLDDAE